MQRAYVSHATRERLCTLREVHLCVFEFSCFVEWDAAPLICTWKSKHIPITDLSLFSQWTVWWCWLYQSSQSSGTYRTPYGWRERLLQLIKGDLKIWRSLEAGSSWTAKAKPGRLAALNASFVRSHLALSSVFRKWVHGRWVEGKNLKRGLAGFCPCKVCVDKEPVRMLIRIATQGYFHVPARGPDEGAKGHGCCPCVGESGSDPIPVWLCMLTQAAPHRNGF